MTLSFRIAKNGCSLTFSDNTTVTLRSPGSARITTMTSAKTCASSFFDDDHKRALLGLIDTAVRLIEVASESPVKESA